MHLDLQCKFAAGKVKVKLNLSINLTWYSNVHIIRRYHSALSYLLPPADTYDEDDIIYVDGPDWVIIKEREGKGEREYTEYVAIEHVNQY